MKIAICDDNKADLMNMTSIIDDYKSLHKNKQRLEYTTFHSSLDLIAAMESGQQYELILLDILMPYLTGMDVAKEIRQFNQDIKIIFLTSSPEFAVESYSVNAFYYALKPINHEKLSMLLDKVILELELHKSSSFIVRRKEGISRIAINRLEFAEVIGRTIIYHLVDGSVIKALGSMSELETELLPHNGFMKPHRSYIINLEYIDTLGLREIKMYSHALIPLSKANSRALKAAYIAYSFNNAKVSDLI